MTKRTKATGSKGRTRKLKLKKETVKDLDAKASGKHVKGGYAVLYPGPQTPACPGGTVGACQTAVSRCPGEC